MDGPLRGFASEPLRLAAKARFHSFMKARRMLDVEMRKLLAPGHADGERS
jgi:hypothetical protein